MELTRTPDHTECKHAIRADTPQFNAFDDSRYFTFLDDIQQQRLLETK